MSVGIDLLGCNIIERDINNEMLWTWSFPTVSEEQQQFVVRKCRDIDSQAQAFAFSKWCKDWCYINTMQVFDADCLPQVKQFALIIWARDYNLDKYETLCRVLSKRYCKTGNPVVVLELYLSVMTQGVCNTEENGTFMISDYHPQRTAGNTQIKDLHFESPYHCSDLIKLFGLETILIYTALLLNKRLFIYHHSLETLLKWVRMVPSLMLHRSYDDSLFPWVQLVPEELLLLRGYEGFIAGCADNGICSRSDVYDVLVNIPAREITISPHTRDSFAMTKTHKDIALFMVQLAENAAMPEHHVVEEIANKTKDLLTLLRSLATTTTPEGKNMISMESLRARNFAPALENFLFNLSLAENMMLI